MEELKQAVMSLSSAEWPAFAHWINNDEKKRREDLPTVQATAERTIQQLRADGVLITPALNEDGAPGNYQPDIIYLPGELVTYEGEVYISFGDGIIKEPPTDATRWKVFANPVVDGGEPVVIYDPAAEES